MRENEREDRVEKERMREKEYCLPAILMTNKARVPGEVIVLE